MGKLLRRFEDELILFIRQRGFLAARPRPHGWKAENGLPLRRIDSWQQQGKKLPTAPQGAGQLVSWLFEAGPTTASAMGELPLSWQDIAAWCAVMQPGATRYELKLLERLSGFWLQEKQNDDPAAPMPGQKTSVQDDPALVLWRMAGG